MKKVVAWFLVLLLGGVLPVTAQSVNGELDHRDDFEMESMSGGDFRSYVSEHIPEDDQWAYSMRTLGNMHNFMHELMTEIAHHGAEERADSALVPAINRRISGGEWTTLRKNLEETGEASAWRNLVQITEIMHDRVHHAMTKAVTYDHKTRSRDVELAPFVREMALPADVAIPNRNALHLNHISQDDFRMLGWTETYMPARWHASMQNMVVFNHLLYDLLTQWGAYGAEHENPACQPPESMSPMTNDGWARYAQTVEACDDATWRELVQIADLMKDRIHHMMYKMVEYGEE